MASSPPRRVLAAALAAAVLAAVPAPSLRAGDEVPGKWYENRLVGFRFKPLHEWAAVPPGTDPRDPKLCGFYSDKAKFDNGNRPECSVYAFKIQRTEAVATAPAGTPAPPPGGAPGGPPPSDEERARERERLEETFRFKSTKQVVATIHRQVKANADAILARMDEKKRKKALSKMDPQAPTEKEVKSGEDVLVLTEAVIPYADFSGDVDEIRVVAGALRGEEFEVGVVYVIPGSEWRKYGAGVHASLRSIQFLEGAEVAAARKDLEDALAGKTGDERWIEEIKRKVGPGWAYVQTKNYLIVHDQDIDPPRVRQAAVQIEAIRKDVYEVSFPPDRPVTAISVVRFCKDRAQYLKYGGSGNSAGYWNPAAKELVFYDDGTKDSFRVLNHEAFHQFIFYSVGSISPHDWFNEGHGDYFAGHDYDRSGRFVPKPFAWRRDLIKGLMGARKHVPLKVFMKYSHAEYYGPAMGQNYAQGWSVIWFLRGTRNPEWKTILPTYFDTLKGEVTKYVNAAIEKRKAEGTYQEGWKPESTPNSVEQEARDKALAAAFGHFDEAKWEKFEKEWRDFKY